MNQIHLEALIGLDKNAKIGHAVRASDMNLGLGWIYYGLTRAWRPKHVVVIGSWRGFVPAVIAHAMLDNIEGGEVTFIDPSLVDDHWKDPEQVSMYFRGLGLHNVTHHCMTTQQFVETDEYKQMHDAIAAQARPPIGMVFVDGLHTAEQAQFDHEAFAGMNVGPTLFHDSRSELTCTLYDQEYKHSVGRYIQDLRERGHSVLDLPIDQGVAIVLPPDPLKLVT